MPLEMSLISASSLITMWTEPLISWYWTDGSMTTITEWGIIGGYYPLNTFFTHSLRKCKTLTCFIAALLQSYIFFVFCLVPAILHAWNGYYSERCWYKPSLNILCEGTDVCVWVYECICVEIIIRMLLVSNTVRLDYVHTLLWRPHITTHQDSMKRI